MSTTWRFQVPDQVCTVQMFRLYYFSNPVSLIQSDIGFRTPQKGNTQDIAHTSVLRVRLCVSFVSQNIPNRFVLRYFASHAHSHTLPSLIRYHLRRELISATLDSRVGPCILIKEDFRTGQSRFNCLGYCWMDWLGSKQSYAKDLHTKCTPNSKLRAEKFRTRDLRRASFV